MTQSFSAVWVCPGVKISIFLSTLVPSHHVCLNVDILDLRNNNWLPEQCFARLSTTNGFINKLSNSQISYFGHSLNTFHNKSWKLRDINISSTDFVLDLIQTAFREEVLGNSGNQGDTTHNASVSAGRRPRRSSSSSPLVYSVLVEDKQVDHIWL